MRSWIVFNLPIVFAGGLIAAAGAAAQLAPGAGVLAVIAGLQCYIPLKNKLGG
ncbi:hypothetical protein FHR99_003178 [Litorivivens lipolytica]|uniref:Uncharacterized protein n=1 Tax=Litorivivens lipolytica TaxID=1524264 RepID=A0A7W4Z6V1_9GAMM|nr:hypothetical protein [Litorivivens lipolytica]MBB3048904.1 hypothetical protein [Litorivivens lipolytica]